ncbi:MAG: VTT domain-containing protein [bacterium]|nr:VTT domain-containing protein [bacterium]
MIIEMLVKYGVFGIMLAGFAEAILLPFPMEVVSVPVYLASPEKAALFACVLALCSAVGSLIGYKICNRCSHFFIKKTIDVAAVKKVQGWYQKNVIFTLLTSAITPIPYEIYVLTAGVFAVDLKCFFVGSLVSRVIRHVPQGLLISYGGNGVIRWCKENMVFVIVCILGVWGVKSICDRKKQKAEAKATEQQDER